MTTTTYFFIQPKDSQDILMIYTKNSLPNDLQFLQIFQLSTKTIENKFIEHKEILHKFSEKYNHYSLTLLNHIFDEFKNSVNFIKSLQKLKDFLNDYYLIVQRFNSDYQKIYFIKQLIIRNGITEIIDHSGEQLFKPFKVYNNIHELLQDISPKHKIKVMDNGSLLIDNRYYIIVRSVKRYYLDTQLNIIKQEGLTYHITKGKV